MPLHLDEFQQPQFQGYVENVPPAKRYLLGEVMPIRQTFDTDFSYGVVSGKYARAASITAFNAGAPLRDKQGLAVAYGSVAKIQHGFRLDEKELIKFTRPRSDAERDSVIDYIYNETDDLVEGVRETEEFFRAQAVYHGRLKFSENDIELDVTYDIPEDNKLTATTPWATIATATPLSDLQAAVKQFKKANRGQMPREIHMSSAAEANLLQNAQIKNQIYGSPTDSRILMPTDIRNIFTALSLPSYVVTDEVVDVGNGDERLLPENRVVLIGNDIGELVVGPTVEKGGNPGMYVVPEIRETNPPQQAVFVGETAFPALKRTSAVVWLDV
ncbi:major capsid protein [Pseudobacillus badius]|uniref:major capsid protein n=1 Tax=Bacillus badius TaxID=1455 RepID=UPI0024A12135|nr:major capsid protein [Bacillus badius]GLY11410.1 hypothetical protein Bbad01_26260 [Bacillus badius]